MFQVQAPVVIVPSTEARAALGVQLRSAALAAWLEIARRGKGIRMARISRSSIRSVTLAVCSRLPPRRVHRDRTWYRRPEAGCASHSCRPTTAGRGSGPGPPAGAPVMGARRGQRRCPRRTHICIDRRCVPPLAMRLRENPAASSILHAHPPRRPLVRRCFVVSTRREQKTAHPVACVRF